MAQIKRGSAVKKAVANFFLSASTAYVRAKRITDGIALQYAIHPRPLWALVWATLTAALLYPLHRSVRQSILWDPLDLDFTKVWGAIVWGLRIDILSVLV